MPFSNPFVPVNFINKSVTPTGTPDIDAAFLNYFQSIVDAQGDGLATYSSDLETLEATVTALGAPFTNPGHISGLAVEFISTTSVRVTSGSCYVPATTSIVSKSTDTTINLTGLSASTWYYLYAIDTAGSLSFEYVTTGPVIYYGTAKQKSGDSSRRYIGAFKTNASSQVLRFTRSGPWLSYLEDATVAPFAIVENATATIETSRSCQAVVPTTSKLAKVDLSHQHSTSCFFGNSEDNANPGSNQGIYRMWGVNTAGQLNQVVINMPLDSSQTFTSRFSTTPAGTNGLFAYALGYYEER